MIETDQARVADIIAELDRQITKTIARCVKAPKRTHALVLDTAAQVQRLEAAKATWVHYGHRAIRLAKGAEVA